MSRGERRAGGRASDHGALRSLLGSTAAHGAVIGVGLLLGFGASDGLRTTPAPRAQTTSVVRVEREPLVREEPERLPEAVADDAPLPEPEPLPLAPEEAPVFEADPTFTPLPAGFPGRAEFDARSDFAGRPAVADESAEPAPPIAEPPPVAASEHGDLVLTPPIPTFRPDPEYPRVALRRGEEGVVLCRIHVDARGGVRWVELEESSGSARLDEAALEALATWRFRPCTIDGVKSPSIYRHRVRFELGG